MSKNRIIPQMFDVRPVDETGDLDWKKIQSIGGLTECIGDEPTNGERNFELETEIKTELQYDVTRVNAYVLGMPFESKDVPVLHEPTYSPEKYFEKSNTSDVSFQQVPNFKHELALEEKRQKELAQQERKLQQIAEQNRMMEQHLMARKELEARMLAERQRHEMAIREEKEKKQQQRREILEAEKRQLEQQHAQWLEKEMIAEAKARKLQEFIAKKSRKREILKNKNAYEKNIHDFSWRDILFPLKFSFQFDAYKSLNAFVSVMLVISLSLGSVAYASKGLGIKGKVLGSSTDGLENLNSAIKDVANQNFEGSSQKFEMALASFSDGSRELESMGGMLLDVTRFVPFASKVSSGKNAVEAGKHFSAAGKSLNEVAKVSAKLKNPIDQSGQSEMSLLDAFKVAKDNAADAKKELDAAQQNIDRISIDDLPEDQRDKFLLVKQKLPDLTTALDVFLSNSHIVADLLGANGPRKYLFLFQNNSEMRATGGFIGSYGLLDIANGHVKKFFIDGIFNPDGQLKDRIVPPAPIQKISTNWSLHDSNWFADFPVSAKKAVQFYEKTGGPTVDGVITFTPTVMQKLLEITGPIEMPEYEVTLDSNNFIELTQYKVEVDYDKEENRPKKILSDLAPLVLEKLFSSKDLSTISKTSKAFFDGLEEKHILFYSENSQLQKIISEQGWSGEIIQTSKDYISVINTNVNGYKTDAVVEEKIEHTAQIQDDGSIVDTVTITRKHNGGNSEYEWLNKVNANYMRVYVPEGSKLLEVSGQTRETNEPPVDYDALGFKRDENVQNEESKIKIDEESGTRIYSESGKTVFANWTYVSPQETMSITYKYILPFALFKVSVGDKIQVDSYALTAQKQSGSVGSSFSSKVLYPSNYKVVWNFPSEGEKREREFQNDSLLKTDQFIGIVFEKNR